MYVSGSVVLFGGIIGGGDFAVDCVLKCFVFCFILLGPHSPPPKGGYYVHLKARKHKEDFRSIIATYHEKYSSTKIRKTEPIL